ncbi:MAG: methyltransferase [Desulfovibrio sp.]|uniref:methyltransferase n=1 Tax=Desulfovibrio sp. 7SRBS1 TaxID=3378064 RepID=UPI003B421CC9
MNTSKHDAQTELDISLDAPLDELLDAAKQKYDLRFDPTKIGDTHLEILQINDMPSYLDSLLHDLPPGAEFELPLWAKMWPPAFMLSFFLQRIPSQNQAGEPYTMLELGGGVGICGLFAAAAGFKVTITDIVPDALLFTRINILHNGLEDRATVCKADFLADRLGKKFDYIVASDIIYGQPNLRPLVKFLLAHLASRPEAEVILAKGFRRNASRFLGAAEKEFLISEKTIGIKSEDERHLTQIYRMRKRKNG